MAPLHPAFVHFPDCLGCLFVYFGFAGPSLSATILTIRRLLVTAGSPGIRSHHCGNGLLRHDADSRRSGRDVQICRFPHGPWLDFDRRCGGANRVALVSLYPPRSHSGNSLFNRSAPGYGVGVVSRLVRRRDGLFTRCWRGGCRKRN